MCPKSNTLTNDYSKNFLKYFRENDIDYEQLLETTRNDIRLHGCLRKETYEEIRKNFFPEKRSKEPPYPLRFYYDFGLPVAICTDNPCISNASMTEEYMEACRRSGGFSKWDILRIIKMGFKNAFLPKEEVARMLQRVGNEIYDKVLKLEKIERPYRPSAD
jgi:adenosine deaminase